MKFFKEPSSVATKVALMLAKIWSWQEVESFKGKIKVRMGYSHLSDREAPIIPTNSKTQEIPTVFWLGSYLSDSKKGL